MTNLSIGTTEVQKTVISEPGSLHLKFIGSRIHYQVPNTGKVSHVSIKLYNIQGKLIRTLVDGVQGPGPHAVDMKSPLASGVYMVKMEAGGFCKSLNGMLTK